MDLMDATRVFLRVAELSSFTAAARGLSLPRASVSAAVQQLEERLGTRLLQRTTRRVTLTRDGETFYARARDLVGDFDELTSLFHGDDAPLVGRLRVDTPIGLAGAVIEQLPVFLAAHPALEVELSSTDRMVDVIREGFDCVVRAGTRADSGLVARPLGAYQMVNCVSAGYAATHGVPTTLEDLQRHRIVHYAVTLGVAPDGFEYVDAVSGAVREIPMTGVITVNGSTTYEAACRAGLGIIQTPRIGVQGGLLDGSLVEVLRAFRAPPLPVALIYPDRRHVPRRARVFMEFLAAVVVPRLAESPTVGVRQR